MLEVQRFEFYKIAFTHHTRKGAGSQSRTEYQTHTTLFTTSAGSDFAETCERHPTISDPQDSPTGGQYSSSGTPQGARVEMGRFRLAITRTTNRGRTCKTFCLSLVKTHGGGGEGRPEQKQVGWMTAVGSTSTTAGVQRKQSSRPCRAFRGREAIFGMPHHKSVLNGLAELTTWCTSCCGG